MDTAHVNGHAAPPSIQDELATLRAELELEQTKTEIARLKGERRALEDYERWLGPKSDETPKEEPPRKQIKARNLCEAIFIGTHRSVTEAYSDYASYTGTGWGALVDPLDAYTDVDGFLLPSAGIADRRTNATSLLTPLIRNELQLLMVRGAARLLLDMNQFAIGVLENLTAFVVGEGMPCRAVWRKGHEKKGDNLPLLIQDRIDEFYERVAYDEFQQELFWRTSRDGEHFLRYEEESLDSGFRTGLLYPHIVEPEFVTQTGAPQDVDPKTGFDAWTWGIHTPHLCPQKALAYNLQPWSAMHNEVVLAQQMDHVKINVDRNLKRGIPDFAPVADGLEGCRKLVRNTREGAAVMAAIAGIWEYDGTPGSQVQGAITQNRDAYRAYNPHPVTGKQINYQKIEPGTFVHAPKSKQFKPLASGQSNTPGYVQAVQMALRAVAVRWGMPEYIVSSDASNGNFASILVAGSPFVRQVQRRQKFFKRRFLQTLWRVVHCAWHAKRFGDVPWHYLKQSIELQLEPPTPQIADRVQEAQANEIEARNGILSKQTWRARRGYDNDIEKRNLEEEPTQQQPTAPGKPQDGGDALGGLGSFFPRPKRPDEGPTREGRRVRETKDAKGHEHAADGKFGTGGSSSKSSDKGKGKPADAEKHQALADAIEKLEATPEGRKTLGRGAEIGAALKSKIQAGVLKAVEAAGEEGKIASSFIAAGHIAAGTATLASSVFQCVHEEVFEMALSQHAFGGAHAVGMVTAKVAAHAEMALLQAVAWSWRKLTAKEARQLLEAKQLTDADKQLVAQLGKIAADALQDLLREAGVPDAEVNADAAAQRIEKLLRGEE